MRFKKALVTSCSAIDEAEDVMVETKSIIRGQDAKKRVWPKLTRERFRLQKTLVMPVPHSRHLILHRKAPHQPTLRYIPMKHAGSIFRHSHPHSLPQHNIPSMR